MIISIAGELLTAVKESRTGKEFYHRIGDGFAIFYFCAMKKYFFEKRKQTIVDEKPKMTFLNNFTQERWKEGCVRCAAFTTLGVLLSHTCMATCKVIFT